MATVAHRRIFNLPLYNDTCGILICVYIEENGRNLSGLRVECQAHWQASSEHQCYFE